MKILIIIKENDDIFVMHGVFVILYYVVKSLNIDYKQMAMFTWFLWIKVKVWLCFQFFIFQFEIALHTQGHTRNKTPVCKYIP